MTPPQQAGQQRGNIQHLRVAVEAAIIRQAVLLRQVCSREVIRLLHVVALLDLLPEVLEAVGRVEAVMVVVAPVVEDVEW